MPQSIKTLGCVSTIIVLWVVFSAVIGWTLGIVPQCTSLGVAICLMLLAIANSHDNTWQRLTGQSHDEHDSALGLFVLLIVIPTSLLIGITFAEIVRYIFKLIW